MESEEIQNLVEELDLRLERLRVLFDQYFQGIEKIPPSIVQKDVDRRIWVLRREKIRNTGTRFRFQQIVQRYNTFSSFWMRTCREIENGTYKRDVLRAKKRFGDPRKTTDLRASEPPPSIELVELDVDVETIDDLDDLDDITEITENDPVSELDAPLDDVLRTYSHDTTKMKLGPAMTHRPAPTPATPVAPKPAQPPHPFARQPVVPPAASVAKPVEKPAPQPAPPAERPKPHPSVPKILAAKVQNDDDLDDMLDAALGHVSPPKPAKEPTRTPPPVARPQQPAHPFAARPSAPSVPSAPVPSTPSVPSQPRSSSVTSSVVSSQASSMRASSASVPTSNGRPSSPSSDEYRSIYAKYVDAKRANGESTASITYESLAKNLRETAEKLKQKSGGKKIDFDVVVKDGKTILKPVVK